MARQFSVPYNGDYPDEFMEKLLEYRENVHDVYLGIPGVEDFFTKTLLGRQIDYYDNCIEFLQLAEANDIPTVLVYNAANRGMTMRDKETMVRYLQHYISKYDVSGLVCADLDVAELIHRVAPDLEINTSCNNPHYNTYSLIEWRKRAGVTLVNPPRDCVRDYKYLQELKNKGFRVKLLVNEFCYLNCGRITQFCEVSSCTVPCRSQELKENILLSCRLFPQQLEDFDKVVDIYKIQGRWMETDYIFRVLDIYAKGRPCKISEISTTCGSEFVDFSTDEIDPDLVKFWINGCPRDCYNCKRCETEWRRLKKLHKNDDRPVAGEI